MELLKQMEEYGHQQIVFGRDEKTGLKAIIAVHDTTLGPAIGGTRFWNYANEGEALYDVLRLSRGMTLKNAAAGLPHGGGKAVIIGDAKKLKSQEFFHAYGRIINSLGGIYYTAEDVNISAADIGYVNEVTKYVTGTPAISGNPSPFTARGVFLGIKAGAKVKFGSESLAGKTVAVQGLGSVGYALCGHLHNDGAQLKVYDINESAVDKAVQEFGAVAVTADEILSVECDIFAPCALGAVLNADNVANLKCELIGGAANNVLVDADTGDRLRELDILYLPDYIINAGGVINAAEEVSGQAYDAKKADAKVDKIFDTTLKIIELARARNLSTYDAAEQYAMNIVLSRR